jgi:predicted methyltransferase
MNRISLLVALCLMAILQACDRDTTDQLASVTPESSQSAANPEQPVDKVSQVVTVEDTMAAILAGDHRSASNKARDQYRHPAETLAFFGLRPDSTVMEIWPGEGWYTEIIAPYVRGQGRFIAAGFDPESEIEFVRKGAAKFKAKLDANPELYDHVEMAVLMPPDKLELAPPDSIDLILTFRNIHNWMPRGSQDAVIAAMYRALKPGGVVGVEEHRGKASEPQDPEAKTGYVNQEYAISLFEKAGFVLDGTSEINANPADMKNYPEGVWTLPPTLRLGEENRDAYLAIGESDRFTLRFIKPVK